MSMWKKAMDYLGLGPDDAYDDYDMAPEPERPMRQSRPAQRDEMGGGGGRQQRGGYPQHEYEPEPPPVRTVPSRPSFPQAMPDVAIRRPVPAPDDSSVQPRPINPRPVAPVARVAPASSGSDPYTVKPKRFTSAQEIADKFKEGQPVIMNLEATDRDTERRLIDFASGLCYGLDGSMEKVATGVFLLKPPPRNSSYDDQGYGN